MFYIGSVIHSQPHFLQNVLWEILPCGHLSNKPELLQRSHILNDQSNT